MQLVHALYLIFSILHVFNLDSIHWISSLICAGYIGAATIWASIAKKNYWLRDFPIKRIGPEGASGVHFAPVEARKLLGGVRASGGHEPVAEGRCVVVKRVGEPTPNFAP